MFQVWGKEKKPIERSAINAGLSLYSKCIIDIGAGDAKGSLRYARSHPDCFVISLDSSYDAQNKTARIASKKPERGGARNLLCLYGNVKESDILESIADEIRVILPWGDLLEGIANISEDVIGSITNISKNEGLISYVINAEIWKENLPKDLSDIGEITPDFFIQNKEKFKKLGQEINESKLMSINEIADLDTTWSAKLMSTRDMADFIMATAVVTKSPR